MADILWNVEQRAGMLWRVVRGNEVWGCNLATTEAEARAVCPALNAVTAVSRGGNDVARSVEEVLLEAYLVAKADAATRQRREAPDAAEMTLAEIAQEARDDFARVREALERRYARMGRPLLREEDVRRAQEEGR